MFLNHPQKDLSGLKYFLKPIELLMVYRTGELKFVSVIVEVKIVGMGQRRGAAAITASLDPRGIMILAVTVRLVLIKNLGEFVFRRGIRTPFSG